MEPGTVGARLASGTPHHTVKTPTKEGLCERLIRCAAAVPGCVLQLVIDDGRPGMDWTDQQRKAFLQKHLHPMEETALDLEGKPYEEEPAFATPPL